ncbi:hypothetical protein [Glycomyces artemisiae]|uniref:Uncharacterized protein n=1 Tax=Glycomyces artemisiae TaxID=1076443 RepID=A0A2T0UL84_9ACTN|nr:hypothetical protein [Glycomyces artemisiae]PRY58654.1 hypothetical protein B0I28_105369 [Glycomyces artemisiae]
MFESTRVTAEEVVRRIGDGIPAIAERKVDRIFTEIPVYAAGAVVTREVAVQHCTANTVSAFDQLTTCRIDLSSPAKTGRQRVPGTSFLRSPGTDAPYVHGPRPQDRDLR